MMIRKRTTAAGRPRGFTLIELAIVLAVASLLFAGLWRLMSSGNTQLRDQAAADLHGQLIKAVSAYLTTTEGQNLMTLHAANANFELPLPTSNENVTDCKNTIADANAKILCEYLPIGFTGRNAGSNVRTTNSYGQSYEVRVLKDNQAAGVAPKNYSFMILTFDGDTIPDTSGGRIASMIGNDGGFVYTANVCGEDYACGAFGSWAVSPTGTYGFGSSPNGHIASRTYAGLTSSQNAPWLARTVVSATPTVAVQGGTAADFNTIQTDTYLGLISATATTTSYARILGAVSGYGGAIENLRTLTVGRSTDTDQEASLIVVGGGCSRASISDNTCPYVMEVAGSASIDGLLSAAKLYAGQFIYDTSAGSSDRRLKGNIKPIENALDKMAKIGGYSFEMKKSKEKKLGVIAQEVEQVFPEVVHKIDAEYEGVDYIGLIGPLVAAVNELKRENDALKAEMKALKTKVEGR